MTAEIVLVGGAAILAQYGFRDMTYDMDAVISASSVMKEAINVVGDRFGLPNGWLNSDFKKTTSYSDKLSEVSVFYKTYSNILNIRVIAAEYLIAMKLMSGRQYKNDLSDVAGILREHQRNGRPIAREGIEKAIDALYDDGLKLPMASRQFLDDTFANGDFESVYETIRQYEIQVKNVLLDFNRDNPDAMKEENIDMILEKARHKRQEDKG